MKRTIIAALLQLLSVVEISSGRQMQEAVMFDNFEDIQCNDEKARLDNFAIQLQNQQDAIGYIVFYGGREYGRAGRVKSPRRNEAETRVGRLKPYLLIGSRLKPERIVLLNGGYRETWQTELWIVPNGAKPPTPTPTLKPEQIKFRRGVAREKEYRCYV